ncbi:endocuticle structural glycoprotein SgAbd-5 [Plutella xylostella]|uniref:endocuticle structural glycoprotein SgAbd-5 n=1 Tax=Plutella xylostella TaxID=51655 RepID=UPI002032479B|nr:endocuticle structural glycoprotein SgAbd-5 [Plutella xylostella]
MFGFKLLLVAAAVAIVCAQEPAKPEVEVLTETSFVDPKGYHFEFKTSDGTSRKEEAELITVGEYQGIGVKGSYSFVAPDGQEYLVEFTADEKGYRPTLQLVPQHGQ